MLRSISISKYVIWSYCESLRWCEGLIECFNPTALDSARRRIGICITLAVNLWSSCRETEFEERGDEPSWRGHFQINNETRHNSLSNPEVFLSFHFPFQIYTLLAFILNEITTTQPSLSYLYYIFIYFLFLFFFIFSFYLFLTNKKKKVVYHYSFYISLQILICNIPLF